jgi:cytochrome c-type biogenesis protein CcmH
MSFSHIKLNAIRYLIYGVFGLVLLFLIGSVVAQESDPVVSDDEVNVIARELYCPICESTPLDVCPTQACKDWREVIRTKLAEGQTEEEIKAYFELQYGARALAEPPQRGFSLSAWILPVVLVIVVLGGFIYYLRSIRAPKEALAETSNQSATFVQDSSSQGDPDQDDYEARIERELQDM